jgi:DNA (cytosine-5)-methyltransferase 1
VSARVTSGAGSKQTYGTPADFIAAVERRFGKIGFDLAADASNAKASRYYTEQDNALTAHNPWHDVALGRLCWLNPPFADIAPWAEKCAEESKRGARIAFLVPASVGSRWFATHVFGKARVHFLLSRLCFDGKNVFPKDCMLCLFGPDVEPGIELWDWRKA